MKRAKRIRMMVPPTEAAAIAIIVVVVGLFPLAWEVEGEEVVAEVDMAIEDDPW